MTDYKKNLGIKEATSIVISRIIGSGIFRTPAPIMALVGCTSLFSLVWVLGAIITIFGAVIYAELTAIRSGPRQQQKVRPRWERGRRRRGQAPEQSQIHL